MQGTPRLFCFGLGYSAIALCRLLRREGWRLAGTARTAEKLAELADAGIEAFPFGDGQTLARDALQGATHLLISIPPTSEGDPVLSACAGQLAEAAPALRWIGYLSTTGVYGDHGGGWVDEDTPAAPSSERGRRRVKAERDWLAFGEAHGIKTQIFRLAGIYGPGRSVLDDIRAGRAQCIERPGQLFGRIHVEDIARILQAAIARPCGFTIFNVCDDLPASSADVVRYGCALLGVAPPPVLPFERAELSDMAKSFWADNKKVRNDRIKQALGVTLLYPSYREGLASLMSLTKSSAEP
jgi:nucleoside-diphosphate-sugar epimerase